MAALIAEGPSDDRFLPPLFTRALEELCMSAFVDSVEVADVRVLRKQNRPPTIEETVELIEENADSFTLVFFHRDQGAVPERVHLEWLRPLKELWGDRLERLVPISCPRDRSLDACRW